MAERREAFFCPRDARVSGFVGNLVKLGVEMLLFVTLKDAHLAG
jgi:hypothetical protein